MIKSTTNWGGMWQIMRDEAFTEALYGTHDGKRPLGKRRPRLKDKTTMISKNMEICQLISLRSKKKKDHWKSCLNIQFPA